MFYPFPVGLTLDEVRAAVDAHNARCGVKAFIEANRGDFTVFNYVISFDGSFPPPQDETDPALARQYAILRECRGVEFDNATGLVSARKYHKFFNVDQKAETQLGRIDWSEPHVILEKLDGSMITPRVYPDGAIRAHTKMGATGVAEPVNEFLAASPLHRDFMRHMLKMGQTPIFEWCSRQQKIVLDYPDDRLVLTAVRDNETGAYMSYDEMQAHALIHCIEVVRALPGTVENAQAFMKEAHDLEGGEGYVIRFDNGHMVKVKGAWYCRIHSTKDLLQFEKDVWALILEDRMDDAMAFMDDKDRDRVGRFVDAFERGIEVSARRLQNEVETWKKGHGDIKKDFAVGYVQRQADPADKSLLFSIFDGHDPKEVVRNHLKKHIGSATRIEEVKYLVGGLEWDDYRDRDLVLDD